MRSYKVYGIKDGGAESFITTVYSAAEGKAAHEAMKSQAYFDSIVVRNALGHPVIRKPLSDTV
jgi:hypothetical protein|tara:strand:- start:388 stop:576 length:189 start_codon:yes stop_codon:yes gene_type:complete